MTRLLKTLFLLLIFTITSNVMAASSCGELLSQNHKFSVQQEWFLNPLHELEKTFQPGAKIESILNTIEKTDLRGLTFRLEGLMRLYKDIDGAPFALWRVRVKALEDHVGHYTEKREDAEFFEKHADKFSVEEQMLIRKDLERQIEKEKAVLTEFLKTSHWWTQNKNQSSSFDELENMIRSQEWRPLSEDTELLTQRIRKELKKRINGENLELLNDLPKELKKDKPELKERVHELRRNARWIVIYMQALQGLFKLENSQGAEYEPFNDLLDSPLATGPFSKLPSNPRIKNRVDFSNQYFLGLSKLVRDAATIKAWGEGVDDVAAALVRAHLAPNFDQAREMVSERLRSSDDRVKMVKETESLIEELNSTKLLEGVKHELDN